MLSEEINTLAYEIENASQNYYTGTSIISDEEFDRKVENLRKIDPHNKILHQVGWGLKNYGDKVSLPIRIKKSLPKIKNIEAITKTGDGIFVLTPKIDGLSCLLSYEEGKLKLACTRGDGSKGVDITPKIPYLRNGKSLLSSEQFSHVIRGELFIEKSVFEENLSEENANPRNAVSGIINRKSFSDLEYVSFISHDPYEKSEKIDRVPSKCYTENQISNKECKNYYKSLKKTEYPVDGVVVNSEYAWKSENSEKEGIVKRVKWSCSPRGKMCPTIELEEKVELYGTKVGSSISAYHAGFISANRIGSGSIVRFTKANEIIPYITKVVKSSQADLPSFCPKCGNTELTFEHLDLRCNSEICRLKGRLTTFMSHYFTTDNLTNVKNIAETLSITSFEDLYSMTASKAVERARGFEGWGDKKLTLLKEIFDEKRILNSDYFLAALGLRDVGIVLSKRSSKILENIESMEPSSFCEKIKAPSHSKRSIVENWNFILEIKNMFHNRLSKSVEENKQELSMKPLKVVITGTLSKKRSEIVKELNSRGIIVQVGISKDTDYLILGEISRRTNKIKRAEDMSKEGELRIIKEQEIKSII